MNQRGFTQGNEQMIPPSLALYEEYRAKGESLYLDSDIYSEIIYYYIDKKEVQKAELAIADGLNIHPGCAAILLEKAYIQFDRGEIEDCQKTINLIPDQSEQEVILLKADVYLAQGDLGKTTRVLEPLKQKENLDVITNCIYLFLDYGFKQEAKKWVDLGKHKFQNNTEFLIAESDFYKSTYQIKEASNAYEKLIDKDPYNESYWIGQASCLLRLNRVKLCIKACKLGLAVNDKSAELYATLGHAYAMLNKYKLALENLNIAHEIGDFNKEELELMIQAINEKVAEPQEAVSTDITNIEDEITDLFRSVLKASDDEDKNEIEMNCMDLLDRIANRLKLDESSEEDELSASQKDLELDLDSNLPTDIIDYFNDFADEQEDDKRVEKELLLARKAYDKGEYDSIESYIDNQDIIFESIYNIERFIDTLIYVEQYSTARIYTEGLEHESASYLNTLRLTVINLLNDLVEENGKVDIQDRFDEIPNDKLEFEITQDNISEFRDHLQDYGLYFLASLIDTKFNN